MESYVCENVFVPLRSGPSHKSEMLSQVLFGEKYTIKDQVGKWLKIESDFDGYQGWIDKDHLQHSIDKTHTRGLVITKALACLKEDNSKMVLEPGSEIYNPDFDANTFTAGEKLYRVTSAFNKSYISINEGLTDTAIRFMNSPYIWGGRIPSGLDCSGLTQLIYKIHGITIPRDSQQQSENGTTVSFIHEVRPGDLVFFDNERGQIAHVGMIISEGLVIHASGRVRIDAIDHQGIFKSETKKYSHRLRLIKRIIN